MSEQNSYLITKLETGDVEIEYTNWRGERSLRRIRPLRYFHGANRWHPTPCWQCWATDLDTGALRYFVLGGMHAWRELDQLPLITQPSLFDKP